MDKETGKIKVLWILRRQREGAFSVETLFDSLEPEVSRKVDLNIYRYNHNISLLKNIKKIRDFKPDIYHITGGGKNFLVNFLPIKKTLLTVHDIDHYLIGLKGFKKKLFGLIWWRIPLQMTDVKITSISHLSKLKLINTFGIDSNRISIIPNCIHPRFKRIESIKRSKNKILIIGTKENKNIFRVVRAIEGLDCNLKIIGKLSGRQYEILNKCKIDYQNVTSINPEEVVKEYNSSALVIFASTSEGFGLPILEAQATETPVITSNLEPMKIVLGHDLSLVDPYSIESIRFMVKKMLNDSEISKKVVELGKKNVVKYSTRNIGQRYLKEYLRIKEVHNG